MKALCNLEMELGHRVNDFVWVGSGYGSVLSFNMHIYRGFVSIGWRRLVNSRFTVVLVLHGYIHFSRSSLTVSQSKMRMYHHNTLHRHYDAWWLSG